MGTLVYPVQLWLTDYDESAFNCGVRFTYWNADGKRFLIEFHISPTNYDHSPIDDGLGNVNLSPIIYQFMSSIERLWLARWRQLSDGAPHTVAAGGSSSTELPKGNYLTAVDLHLFEYTNQPFTEDGTVLGKLSGLGFVAFGHGDMLEAVQAIEFAKQRFYPHAPGANRFHVFVRDVSVYSYSAHHTSKPQVYFALDGVTFVPFTYPIQDP